MRSGWLVRNLNPTPVNAHVKGQYIFVSGWGQHGPRLDVKACSMAWADDAPVLDVPAGQLAAIMGTEVLYGEKLSSEVDYRNGSPVDVHNLPFAWSELMGGRDVDPAHIQ
jgi:hypothetical protein